MIDGDVLAAEVAVRDEQVAQPPVQVEGDRQRRERDRYRTQHPRDGIPAPKTVVLDGDTGDRRLRGQQRTPDAHDQAGADARRHQPGSAVAKGLHQVVPDEAEREDEVGDVETAAGTRWCGATSGCGAASRKGPTCGASAAAMASSVTKITMTNSTPLLPGTPRPNVEVPRQQQSEEEQRDRDAVAHPVGAGGHETDLGRPEQFPVGGHRGHLPSPTGPVAAGGASSPVPQSADRWTRRGVVRSQCGTLRW